MVCVGGAGGRAGSGVGGGAGAGGDSGGGGAGGGGATPSVALNCARLQLRFVPDVAHRAAV